MNNWRNYGGIIIFNFCPTGKHCPLKKVASIQKILKKANVSEILLQPSCPCLRRTVDIELVCKTEDVFVNFFIMAKSSHSGEGGLSSNIFQDDGFFSFEDFPEWVYREILLDRIIPDITTTSRRSKSCRAFHIENENWFSRIVWFKIYLHMYQININPFKNSNIGN
jgi:hypothetical protein